MATITELNTRREALSASRSSGVARVSYDGKTVEYRSLAEIERAIEQLDREIAATEGRRIDKAARYRKQADAINVERDRRIAAGFWFDGKRFDFDPDSVANITGAGASAGIAGAMVEFG